MIARATKDVGLCQRWGRNARSLASAREPSSAALAFALRSQRRKRVHNADEIMAEIVAKRLVQHLERAPIVGGVALGRGFEG